MRSLPMKSYDPYELMITPPNKKAEMLIHETRTIWPNLDLVRDLISLGANLDWQDDRGRVPLHVCAKWNHPEIARMIIDAGADLNIQDENGMTALHWCAWTTDPELLRMLIEAGADKTIPDNRGRLPYDLTIKSEFLKLLKV